MPEAADQRRVITELNVVAGRQFRLLQGIEANTDADGQLDLTF